MATLFTVTFSNQLDAAIAQVMSVSGIPLALEAMELAERHRPVLVVIGGASKLGEADYQQVQRLFLDVLAPIAQKWQASVVDGGTDAGVMRLMGQARDAIDGTFPLIGVAPIGLARLPDQPLKSEDAIPLEPYHSHFFLVPGSSWGDESAWIAAIASELAGSAPSITVLINGGEITWADALQNVRAGRGMIVIAGSGRTADLLAAGLRGEPTDARAEELIASGLVQMVELSADSDVLTTTIEAVFAGES
ncbi:MAG: hypothetical protein KME10_07740 [Plectolyngbya sp. WJT66-NPBG17]|jgi:hypothetical protein|nr:hypothetical protein [Plectolyngbya sp. WJT66-NPBG17]